MSERIDERIEMVRTLAVMGHSIDADDARHLLAEVDRLREQAAADAALFAQTLDTRVAHAYDTGLYTGLRAAEEAGARIDELETQHTDLVNRLRLAGTKIE